MSAVELLSVTPSEQSQIPQSGLALPPENTEDINNTVNPDSQQNAPLDLSCNSPDLRSAMLTLTNNARAQSRQCGGTRFPATQALSWDTRLETAATIHNNDMINNNFFSHTGSNGLSVSHRVEAQGYDWFSVGENIAAGQSTADATMSDWLNSAGHCQNIMSGDFVSMAVACRIDPRSDYGVYWTAVYAR